MIAQSSNSKLVSKLFFRLLPLLILLDLVSAVSGMISSLFAGNFIGVESMAAMGLWSPIKKLLNAVCAVFVCGAQISCGKYMGANQLERTQSIFITDLIITTAISLLTAFVLIFGISTDLTRIMTADAAVRSSLNRCLLGQLPGIPAMMVGRQLSAFLPLENQSRRVTISSLCNIATKLVFSYLFVVVLQLDILGLSLATSVGYWIALLVQALFYLSGKSVLKPFRGMVRKQDAAEIVKTGYTGAVSSGYQTLRGFMMNALILHFVGAVGLSACAAADSVLNLFWTIPTGILSVSRILVSVNIGEEDRQSLTDTMRVALFKCIPLMFCVSAVIMALAVPMTRLFFRDPAEPVYQMTVAAFRIIPLSMPLCIILLQFNCYAQASGKQFLIHLLSALDGVVFMGCFSVLLMPRMGMSGLYVAYILNGIGCAAVIVIYAWIKLKKFPRNMEQLMVIPDEFGAGENDRMDISVREKVDVINVSKQVIAFCESHGLDEMRTYMSGLFLEEMAGNVVEHGFNKDKKSHSVDIRVVFKDEDVILRIKDDCVPFNPAEWQEIYDPKDRLKGAGIRMVYKGAKDVKYQNILGLNVLAIRI